MNDVLWELHQDHINVARLLDEIGRQAALIRAGGAADYRRLTDIMRYMTEYPDLVHHPKEDLVFARLLEKDRAAAAAVAELTEEHGRLAAEGSRAYGLLRSIGGDVRPQPEPVAICLESYERLLRGHMNKEESRVFPLIRVVLHPADWSEIDADLQSRRDPLFGSRIEDSYRGLYEFICRDR